jgi:gamma-glutamylcyclotransferase
MDVWYFAYGSNLWTDQMRTRVGSIGRPERPPRIARLAGYRLVFQQCEPDGNAYANIVAADAGLLGRGMSGQSVLGVVYRLNEAELAKLDAYERGYERRPITVVDLGRKTTDGETLDAVAYIVRPADDLHIGRPSEAYLSRIITGARQHGLPESYIDEVIAIASIDAS